MNTIVLTAICILMIFAYIFDITSRYTRIPSVVLLLMLGWIVARIAAFLNIRIPDLNNILPVIGTLGLILIVLEGGLELEIEKSKTSLIIKSFLLAVIPMLILAILFALILWYFYDIDFMRAMLNVVPFCVISSAIAIPTVKNLDSYHKELVIYESSFSDIAGVLLFNFLQLNTIITVDSFLHFGLQTIIMILVSVVSIILLSYLLSKLTHHITYTPIIILIILIYSLTKQFHLPALLFILVFSLFLGNIEKFSKLTSFIGGKPGKLEKEILKFKEITFEATFLVRSSFFLLFGFLINTSDLINIKVLPWSLTLVAVIIAIRFFVLKIFRLSVKSLLFIAPRGLITVLLFLSISPLYSVSQINDSLVIQTIILSVFLMMIGMFVFGKYTDLSAGKEGRYHNNSRNADNY